MKYPKWTGGQTEALLNKLGGEDGAKRVLRGDVILTEDVTDIPPAIALGLYENYGAYCQALKDGGFIIGNFGSELMRDPIFTCASKGTVLHPLICSGASLGQERSEPLNDIYGRGKERGLDLCDPQVHVGTVAQVEAQKVCASLTVEEVEVVTRVDGMDHTIELVAGELCEPGGLDHLCVERLVRHEL